jgi:hypothetical protein
MEEAPATYHQDGWFENRNPIAVTSRYGQNQPIGLQTHREGEELYSWETMRQWSKIKYVTVALATHLR